VSLPDGHVASVEHVGRTHEPRNVWRWRIYVPDRPVMAGDDLTTAMDVSDPDPLAALSTLGAFLGDYADTRHLDSDALFLGLSQHAARALSDEIGLNIPDADADGLDDPMLTVHATEVDQDGRGPNEWLVEVSSDPSDVEPRALLCSTSNPYPLLATMRAHGVTVVEHPFCGEHPDPEWPCPTCDVCNRSQCHTEDMEWNGETGNHVACEVSA
jgi:hypothetical protein